MGRVVTCDVCGCKQVVEGYDKPLDICMGCVYETDVEDSSEEDDEPDGWDMLPARGWGINQGDNRSI